MLSVQNVGLLATDSLAFHENVPQLDVPRTAERDKRLLKKYGAEAQRLIGLMACSYDLQMLVCRFAAQEDARGKVPFWNRVLD